MGPRMSLLLIDARQARGGGSRSTKALRGLAEGSRRPRSHFWTSPNVRSLRDLGDFFAVGARSVVRGTWAPVLTCDNGHR